jgi:hypothetical protein
MPATCPAELCLVSAESCRTIAGGAVLRLRTTVELVSTLLARPAGDVRRIQRDLTTRAVLRTVRTLYWSTSDKR